MLLEGCSGNPMCRVQFPAALCLGSVGYGAGFRGSCVITPAPARPYASWQLYTVMSNENENEKSVQQGSCCGKLKFSMVRDMLVKREIEMDEPGMLAVVDMESVHTQMELDGLDENDRRRWVLSMLTGTFAQLAKDGMEYNPKALAVLGEWWDRSIKDSEKSCFLKGLMDVLSK